MIQEENLNHKIVKASTDDSGITIKGFTENDIVWVSDTTNRLTYTNKKGITIAKET